MTRANDLPLDDAELDRLDLLLDRCADPADGIIGLEMLDGFLSAVLAGPVALTAEDYLPAVWGTSTPRRDARQTEEAQALIARLEAQILRRIAVAPDERPGGRDAAHPFLGLPEEAETVAPDADDPLAGLPADFPYASAWAGGFLHGTQLRAEAWDAWLDAHEDIANDVLVISRLALVNAEHAREVGADEADVLSLAERFDLADDLPEMLHDMFLQRIHDQRPAPVRRETAPGRNDPCPCGSGKKYKKCHGAG
ncbi:UPF0149 family protein [Coralloluteibacterium thermophilus]|uniref:UPF0149 family protein n=1 Tax=Coralloluteibacterium thermophilum TaxID=2707049 RepID=A0ABV9NJY6_9GAMM